MKPFSEITTDAEYMWAVGMGDYAVPTPIINPTDPARKWENLANVLRVLGPEMDRRGWHREVCKSGNAYMVSVLCGARIYRRPACHSYEHIALLEAFYNAHRAQGDEA